MLLGNPHIAIQDAPAVLARQRATIVEVSAGHGVKILGTSEVRYGVGLGIEWGRPGRLMRSSGSLAVREEVHLRVFRSFTENEGFNGVVVGFGTRWHGTRGRFKNGYFESGSGISLTDGVSVDVNAQFNFASFFGGGFFLSSNEDAARFGIRWVHVSNLGIDPPNRGLNQFEAVLGFRF